MSTRHHAHLVTVLVVAAATAGRTQSHPDVPVVERLEDLWLLQKLQQDRAQRQDGPQRHNRAQQQDRTQQQAAKDSVSRTQPCHPGVTAPARTAGGTEPGLMLLLLSCSRGLWNAPAARQLCSRYRLLLTVDLMPVLLLPFQAHNHPQGAQELWKPLQLLTLGMCLSAQGSRQLGRIVWDRRLQGI